MDELLLARHGEATSSAEGRVDGNPGSGHGLTARGREQAAALGRSLAGHPIDLCVTSTFPRAVATADLALADRTEPPAREVWPIFDDARFGTFEGARLEEYRRWVVEHGPFAAPAGGGESRADTILRFCRGLDEVLARSEGTVLVVAHGILVAAVAAAAGGEPPTLVVDQPAYGAAERFDAAAVGRATNVLRAWAGVGHPA